MDTRNVRIAFIGEIPEPIFQRLREAGVIDARYRTAEDEYAAFEAPFLDSYHSKNPKNPPQIPSWRLFARYADNGNECHFLHPFASETAFPAKGMMRIAAKECCDAKLGGNGLITTADQGIIAAIYAVDRKVLVIQGICDDPEIVTNPSISAGAHNPFIVNLRPEPELIPYFQKARQTDGNRVSGLLRRPPYFPVPRA